MQDPQPALDSVCTTALCHVSEGSDGCTNCILRISTCAIGDGLTPLLLAVPQKEGQKHETMGNIQEKAGNVLHNDKLKAKGASQRADLTPMAPDCVHIN